MATTAERQAAYRARQKAKGLTARTLLLNDDELFFVERMIAHLRANKGSAPAMMRGPDGRLSVLDV